MTDATNYLRTAKEAGYYDVMDDSPITWLEHKHDDMGGDEVLVEVGKFPDGSTCVFTSYDNAEGKAVVHLKTDDDEALLLDVFNQDKALVKQPVN